MLSLKPGETLNLGDVLRIRFSVKGQMAERVEIWQTDAAEVPLRRASKSDFVLEFGAGFEGKTTLELRPRGSAIVKGALFVEFTPIADHAGGTYDLTGIELDGSRHIPLAEVFSSGSGDYELTSLVGARRVVVDASDESGPEWVNATQRSVRVGILVDRSASMAWAFREGVINSVVIGLLDGLRSRTSGENVRCLTYGAAGEEESLQEVQRRPDPQRPFDYQPDLYSSGARIPWSAVSSLGVDLVFIVTDDPEPAPSHDATQGQRVAFVRPSGSADLGRFPRELQVRIQACDEAGCPVLVVAPQAIGQLSDGLSGWTANQLKRHLEVVSMQ